MKGQGIRTHSFKIAKRLLLCLLAIEAKLRNLRPLGVDSPSRYSLADAELTLPRQ